MNRPPGQHQRGEDYGLVFNVQRFSLHDGQGIRTLIFLKGCPLRCGWCSNPEGQSSSPELAYNAEKCIGTSECGICMGVCKQKAVKRAGEEKVEIDRSLCNLCGECIDECPARALALFGKYMRVDEVLEILEQDSAFYARSGGGVTIGGGEPLSQAEFAGRLLERAQGRGLDTALETSGHGEWEGLKKVCTHANQIYFDIKSMDPEKHRRHTGFSNRLILENFKNLRRTFPEIPVRVRTPVVPGFNDSLEEIRAILNFINQGAGSPDYELLPYHGFGEPKYHQLGKKYPCAALTPLPESRMNLLKEALLSR